MSKFYTHVHQFGNKIYVRGHHSGKRFEQAVWYKPTYYVKTDTEGAVITASKMRTLDGQRLGSIKFDSIKEASKFIDQYEDVVNFNVYGFNRHAYAYIADNYKRDFDYHIDQINIGTLDIETDASGGFPDIKTANKAITAISLKKNKYTVVLGCGDYKVKKDGVKYIKCSSEEELLTKFIETWRFFDLDIVTGWNVNYFDIIYTVNRIARVLSLADAEKLSPWGRLRFNEGQVDGRDVSYVEIVGISVIDYMDAYKKFSFKKHESYTLDYISSVVLGEKKLDYSEYESLHDLFTRNYDLFIDYNLHDVELVDRLEKKLGLLKQIIAIAYMTRVNYVDAFTSVLLWDVVIYNYLRENNIAVAVRATKGKKFGKIVGAYVKRPLPAAYDWVVAFDLDSLYPHLIMGYNISPETLVEFDSDLPDRLSIEDFIDGKHLDDYLVKEMFSKNNTVTPNGAFFSRDKRGFLAQLMFDIYNGRVEYKKKKLELEAAKVKSGTSEFDADIAKAHNMQLALKIILNSAYGALSNEYFRYFSIELAEAITFSGQLAIKWIEKKINAYMNAALGTKDDDFCITMDTDSIYVRFDDMVKKKYRNKSTEEIVEELDVFCKTVMDVFIDESYLELSKLVNAYEHKMHMKRETIASRGLWTDKKKKYILNVYDSEGVRYKVPEVKIVGIEAVRSDTPRACRPAIKEAMRIILQENEAALQDYVKKFESEYMELPFEEIAIPSSVNGLDVYADSNTVYKSKTPMQVRAALMYNKLLRDKKLTDKYVQIHNGDKVKYISLHLPNPIGENVIACPVSEFPKEFDIYKYIDKDDLFEKKFITPVKRIADVVGWSLRPVARLDSFFV